MFKFAIVIAAFVAVVFAAPVNESMLFHRATDKTNSVAGTTPIDESMLLYREVEETTLVDETSIVDRTTAIPILWERMQGPNADGSYWWSYEAGNGIKSEEKGTPKEIGTGVDAKKVMIVEGKYSYPDKDGTLIEVTYIADENGFRVTGPHLPIPPPMPPGISRALDWFATQSKTTPARPIDE